MPRPDSPAPASDRLVRLQILLAFAVPLLLVVVWLGSRGFFSNP